MSVQPKTGRRCVSARAHETAFLLSLIPVRKSLRLLICGLVAIFSILAPLIAAPQSPQETPPPSPQEAPAQPTTPPEQPEPASPQTPAPLPAPSGPVVVINPAHGGTDSGARGQDGTIEKDLVLQFARALRAELDRQGFRAILTRNDDSNPSYDDRAGTANAYHDIIFISLHVSSTGTFGAVRTYYDEMGSAAANPLSTDSSIPDRSATPAGWVVWNEAQRPYLAASHRLATLIQIQCAQSFAGSPYQPEEAPIRELRSIEGPAVAVELSSVSGGNAAASLVPKAAPLAVAIARGVGAFRADSSK
jgi:N-acetylmuramoyl-L-alanine amidase